MGRVPIQADEHLACRFSCRTFAPKNNGETAAAAYNRPVRAKFSSMREVAMPTRFAPMIVRASLIILVLLAAVPQVSHAADGDLIAVDLNTCNFKVWPEIVDLFGYADGENRLFFYASGAGETAIKLLADGDYEVVIRASCDPALGERAKFKLALDGEPLGTETLLTDDDQK